MLTGKHLIAGEWSGGRETFVSSPAHGDTHTFSIGTAEDVDKAVKAAEDAFWSYGYSSRKERAAFLEAIADEIEARGEEITAIGTSETGLPEARLQGERGRTTGQLRLFATHILKGDYTEGAGPGIDVYSMRQPLGVCAGVTPFNFPAMIPMWMFGIAIAVGNSFILKPSEHLPLLRELVRVLRELSGDFA